jgi:hypothetical protein
VFSDECFVRSSKTGIEFFIKFDHEDGCDERFFLSEKQQAKFGIHILAAISSELLLGIEWFKL